MYFDRFDIIDAWYMALSHNHAGQWSDSYRRLCKLLNYYKPGLNSDRLSALNDNARVIYEHACLSLRGR